MRTIASFLFFLILVLFVTGCSNHQDSSLEEAQASIQRLEDFGELVEILNIRSGITVGLNPDDPYLLGSYPALEGSASDSRVVWVAVYKTKDESFKIVTLDDTRPPKVSGISKEFK